MSDYVREMMDTWSQEGEQAAYDRGAELIHEIEVDISQLKRQEEAIQALGNYLQNHPDVDTSIEPIEPTPGLDTMERSVRPRLIVDAAKGVWNITPGDQIMVQQVHDELTRRGLDLGVRQPLAVIGTVLSSADGFTRIARNTFEVDSRAMQDDLTW